MGAPEARRTPSPVVADNICPPGTDCACDVPATADRQLSWTAILALAGAGGLLCLIIVKLLGA